MPTESTANFGSTGLRTVQAHHVYTRPTWAGEWTEQEMHCDEAVWSVAPTIPTATLHYYYGDIARAGELQFSRDTKQTDLLRAYVKVVFTMDDDTTRTWYGIIEVIEDQLHGATFSEDRAGNVTVQATGEQTFTAYGLEQLLANHLVTRSYVQKSTGEAVEVERGITFNERGKPNRHTPEAALGIPCYNFAYDPDSATEWSTYEIVQYLLARQVPASAADLRAIDFVFDPPALVILSLDDTPTLYTHHQSTYDLITSVLCRQRLMTWWVEVDETLSPGLAWVRMGTTNATPVVWSATEVIPANASHWTFVFDEDPSAVATIKTTAIECYDQVVVRGRRRRSVFSLGYGDSTLEDGWTDNAQSVYDDGATSATTLPAATEKTDRRKRHAEVRSAAELEAVYMRFAIPWAWTGYVGAGDGGSAIVPAFPIVLTDGSIASETAPHYPLGLTVEPTLPLLAGVNYSDDAIPDGTWSESESPSGEERPPLVAWLIPNTSPSRYQDVEQLGRKADLETEDPDENSLWSCEVRVPPNDRAIELVVHGQPQHVIASSDFTPISGEDDVPSDHDYREMIVTLCVQEDRHAEGMYPPMAEVDPIEEILRVKTIDAGDAYRQDYVCPYTIVSIDDDGQPVRSNGGFLVDDTDKLESIARIAYEWYSTQRQVLYMHTEAMVGGFLIGELVATIGEANSGHNATINTMITEIRITTPRLNSAGPPQPPRMSIVTNWGQLDPLQMMEDERPEGPERPRLTRVDARDFDVRRGY